MRGDCISDNEGINARDAEERQRNKMTEQRELTYGEKAVGLTFNPSGMGDVDKLKKLYAEIIDHMDDFRKGYVARSETEMVRLCSIAITEAQTAQMWAVKAVTYRP